MIKVYTDGSCLGNPGNGGWAFLIINKNDISYRAGFERNATNNQMELMAAIKALEFLDQHNDINLNTDSKRHIMSMNLITKLIFLLEKQQKI